MKFIITEHQKNQIIKRYILEQDDTSSGKTNSDTTVGSIMTKAMNYAKSLFNNNGTSDISSSNVSSHTGSSDYSTGNVGDDWMSITKLVIDKFEGGYWNPECGHPTKGMGHSTETLFGLDRKNGGWDSKPCGQKFFGIIDDEKKKLGMTEFCKVWKHGYKGGALENQLKEIAASCMKDTFDRNLNNFVKSPEVKNKILSNKGLLLHFSYANWNGPGYFKKWAKNIEDGVSKGLSDKQLVDVAVNDRSNSNLYHQDKVNSLIKSNSNLA